MWKLTRSATADKVKETGKMLVLQKNSLKLASSTSFLSPHEGATLQNGNFGKNQAEGVRE